MTKALFFADEQACSDGLAMIDANFRVAAVGAGYELDENGNVIGKDGFGADQPDAQVTTTWDTVKPVADGAVTLDGGVTDQVTHWISDPTASGFSEAILTGVVGALPGTYEYAPTLEDA